MAAYQSYGCIIDSNFRQYFGIRTSLMLLSKLCLIGQFRQTSYKIKIWLEEFFWTLYVDRCWTSYLSPLCLLLDIICLTQQNYKCFTWLGYKATWSGTRLQFECCINMRSSSCATVKLSGKLLFILLEITGQFSYFSQSPLNEHPTKILNLFWSEI